MHFASKADIPYAAARTSLALGPLQFWPHFAGLAAATERGAQYISGGVQSVAYTGKSNVVFVCLFVC